MRQEPFLALMQNFLERRIQSQAFCSNISGRGQKSVIPHMQKKLIGRSLTTSKSSPHFSVARSPALSSLGGSQNFGATILNVKGR